MKSGIVLEGGAFRTIFSSGVCDALLDAGLLPDYFIGVSAGAGYGISYLSRQKWRNLNIICHYANDKRYMGMAWPTSWYATSFFSNSVRTLPFFSVPAMTSSNAASRSP